MDPATMMAMFGGLQQMGGTPLQQATGIGIPQQTGPAAPNPGGLGGQSQGGLLGSGMPAWDKYMQQQNPQPVQQSLPYTPLSAKMPMGQQNTAPQNPSVPTAQGGSIYDMAEPLQPQGANVFNGDPQITPQGADPSGFGAFFGNLDENFQSPSKQMGLGLLGQIHPAAPYAGLLAGGLFGPNKVF